MTERDQSVSEIMESIRRIMADDAGGSDKKSDDAIKTEAPSGEAPNVEIDPTGDEEEPLLLSTPLEDGADAGSDHDVLLLTDPLDPVPGTSDAESARVGPSEADKTPADPDIEADLRFVSQATETAVSAALSRLTREAMNRTPDTGDPDPGQAALEKLIRDALRPALRAWLDENLPPIVESIVEREVARLMKQPKPS